MNQQFNNNFYNNQMMGGQPGWGYQNTKPLVPKYTQPLSQEEIKKLMHGGNAFNLNLTPEEISRGICTHKDHNSIVLQDVGNELSFCPICQETFRLEPLDIDIEELVQQMINVLQSLKTYYVDIPEEYVKQFFIMIPLLRKVPQFYKMAASNFKKYFGDNGNLQQQPNMYATNALAALTNPAFMGAGQFNYGMTPQPQDPVYGMNPYGGAPVPPPMGQPQYGQPQYGQPQQFSNGFGVNAPGYMPANTQQQQVPGVGTNPAGAPDGEVKVTANLQA